MKKLIALLLFLFLLSSAALADVTYVEGTAVDDTSTIEGISGPSAIEGLTISSGATDCETAGCTGTYDTCWTGEHTNGTGYACHNSGASNTDGTDSGGVVTTNGDVYATLDGAGDYIRWVPNDTTTLDEAGTFIWTFTTPSSFDASPSYVVSMRGASKEVEVRISTTGQVVMRHDNSGGTDWFGSDDSADGPDQFTLSTSTTYRCKVSWDTANDYCYISCKKVGSAAEVNYDTSNCSSGMDGFGESIANVYVGDGTGSGINDTYSADDYYFNSGYDNTAPGDPS